MTDEPKEPIIDSLVPSEGGIASENYWEAVSSAAEAVVKSIQPMETWRAVMGSIQAATDAVFHRHADDMDPLYDVTAAVFRRLWELRK